MRVGLLLSDLQTSFLLLYVICAHCGSDIGWLAPARINPTFSLFLLPELVLCDGQISSGYGYHRRKKADRDKSCPVMHVNSSMNSRKAKHFYRRQGKVGRSETKPSPFPLLLMSLTSSVCACFGLLHRAEVCNLLCYD